jgi:hypothetical protein
MASLDTEPTCADRLVREGRDGFAIVTNLRWDAGMAAQAGR